MINKKILLSVFILVALVQLFVPAKMILDREDILDKGKEYKLGNLLNERLFTGDDWKNFKTGTSEIVINHPERVKNNWYL